MNLQEIERVQSQAELLYSAYQVEQAIQQMAQKITATLADTNPVILCVLNGGMVVFGKIITSLAFPLTVDSINASRYRNTTSGSEIQWLYKPLTSLQGRTILVIDDILDEGITLKAIIDFCQQQGAKHVFSAVLIEKLLDSKAEKPIQADVVGLQIPDRYVFGFGMDYQGYLRNANGIYACKGV